ncbi:MAG: restriction endonuclease subunit S [Candidatus Thiodiazotropha sp. (ex Troendleina suluensis)]|nr:restriction endonuclease subunit S [Candidatus Thiodiazotropha sp. (ex Troendleina suluensis)]
MTTVTTKPSKTWTLAPLGDLCQIKGGGTPSRKVAEYYSGSIPWVTVKDFTAPTIHDSQDHITEKAVTESATNLIPSGTVLVVTRVGLGKVAITGRDMAVNQDVKALFPDERILPEYLFWFLVSKADDIARMGTGATVKGITLSQLKGMAIPVPPVEEQCRIIDILKRADGIRLLRKRAQDTAHQLIPALFIDMFGDPVANPNGWMTKPLKEVANIGSGVTKGRKLDGHQTVELPYLAVSNVQDGHLNLTKVKSIRIKPAEIEKYQVLPGDFLMTEGGDPDKLGRGAIWNGEIDVCLHQNHVFKVRCNREEFLPEYLRSLVGSHYGKGYFLRVAKQTTGIASINKTQLSNFPVLVPPIESQNEFVARLEGIQSIMGQQEAAQASAESSFQSLLHCAFNGGV